MCDQLLGLVARLLVAGVQWLLAVSQRSQASAAALTGVKATEAASAASIVARTSTATTMRGLVPGLLPAVGSQVHVGKLRGLRAVLPLAAAAAHSVSASAAIAVATTATAAITAATAAAAAATLATLAVPATASPVAAASVTRRLAVSRLVCDQPLGLVARLLVAGVQWL